VIQIFERRQGRKYDVQFVSEESLRAQKSATTDPLQQVVRRPDVVLRAR